MTKLFSAALCLLALFTIITFDTAVSAQSSSATLFQNPTVNRSDIVFSYAGDLWSVSRRGGDAKRLTTGIGSENDPVFSPDGAWLAFTGEYDGNVDVYVVGATGGVPKRLTYHPGADQAMGWTPDSKRVLFGSGRASTSGFPRLFTIGLEGGFPSELPLPIGADGAFSPDGSSIAYQPHNQWQPDWKRYKGGQTTAIWIARLSDSTVEKLPRENSNDKNAMWVGDTIYFISDRSGSASLYSFDTKSKKTEQLVRNDGLDIKSASATSDAIVYEKFGEIHLYDLKSRKSQKVDIRVAGDIPTLRPRFEKVGTRISNARLSPNGARAVFEARGEILTVPAEKGDPRNLSNTPGVMERDPSWSPDGKWIAYFSDESGEYALHLREQNAVGETKKINLGNPPSFYYSPTWSPDSKKIAYFDKRLTLWYVDLAKGTPVKVDKNPFGLNDNVMEPVWAPDSRWIAYIKQLPNVLRAVFVYSLESGKTEQITDGMSDARYAAFDKNGKYLYFTASTNLGPAISFAEMSTMPHQSTRNVYAAVLRKDLPSPLAPESDEEKIQEAKKDSAPAAAAGASPPAPAAAGAYAERAPQAAPPAPRRKTLSRFASILRESINASLRFRSRSKLCRTRCRQSADDLHARSWAAYAGGAPCIDAPQV